MRASGRGLFKLLERPHHQRLIPTRGDHERTVRRDRTCLNLVLMTAEDAQFLPARIPQSQFAVVAAGYEQLRWALHVRDREQHLTQLRWVARLRDVVG